MKLHRRNFVRSALAAGVVLPFPGVATARKGGPMYRTALIGTGWWGTNILREAIRSGECRTVALCDVDDAQIQSCLSDLKALSDERPKVYKDYRELLDAEKPEIAIVATPDHWHPLITIDCCAAGAHVYVEKPVGHTIREGRAMVQAARSHDRIVQVGTHRRVAPHNVSGMEFLRAGKAGPIGMVRAFVHYGGGSEEPQENEDPPKGLDWDLWCGPAPLRPYNRKIHTRGFRNFLDYANGTLGDWGIHWMDQILWWTDEIAPKSVYSTGGRPIAGPVVNDGARQTTDAPDHQLATFEFENFSVSWEHRRFAANNAEKTDPRQPVGCYFYGTEGTFHMGWLDGWTFYPTDPKKAAIHVEAELHEPDNQNIRELFADFLSCIKSGDRPVSDIEEGHRSTTMSLLGMLSLKLGRSVRWEADREICVQGDGETLSPDQEANALLTRVYRGDWRYPGTEL